MWKFVSSSFSNSSDVTFMPPRAELAGSLESSDLVVSITSRLARLGRALLLLTGLDLDARFRNELRHHH